MANKLNNLMITKSNDLIEARYKLTLVEQRLIFMAVSRINPLAKCELTPQQQKNFEFSVDEYCEFYGVDKKNGYVQVKKAIDDLYERSIKTESKKFKRECRWVTSKTYFKEEGKFEICFTDEVLPYLTQLENQFTHYCLKNITNFKSSHTIRFYELLAQHKSNGKRTIKIELLKEILQISDNKSYDRFNNFNQRVLTPCINEINEFSDLNIQVEKITKGRKVDTLIFTISNKLGFPSLPRRPQVSKGAAKEGEWARKCIKLIEDYRKKLNNVNEKLKTKDLEKLREFYLITGDKIKVMEIEDSLNKRQDRSKKYQGSSNSEVFLPYI